MSDVWRFSRRLQQNSSSETWKSVGPLFRLYQNGNRDKEEYINVTFSTHDIDNKCRTYRVLVKNPQENEYLEAENIGENI
jgi:hypothetical protein